MSLWDSFKYFIHKTKKNIIDRKERNQIFIMETGIVRYTDAKSGSSPVIVLHFHQQPVIGFFIEPSLNFP